MRKTIIIAIIILISIGWAISENQIMLEQFGSGSNNNYLTKTTAEPVKLHNRFDWTNGVVMTLVAGESLGLFDPFSGDFLGCLCYVGTGTPFNAVQGPDNNIYISYQTADAVYMFDTLGTYLGVYADASDGLDNVRGIAFFNNHLFICVSPTTGKAVKEFSGPHTFVRDFVNYAGLDPFDIHFLPDGRALVADLGTTDQIALVDTNGSYLRQVISANFPEQIQNDPILPGDFLTAGFSSNNIRDFDTTGTIYRTWSLTYARGVYRLGNGHLLGSNSTAVYMIDSATGALTIKRNGQGRYFELYAISQPGTSEEHSKFNIQNSTFEAYPNPFNNSTTIKYNVSTAGKVSIKLYNSAGKLVSTLLDDYKTGGCYTLKVTKAKLGIASGIYFVKYQDITNTSEAKIIVQ